MRLTASWISWEGATEPPGESTRSTMAFTSSSFSYFFNSLTTLSASTPACALGLYDADAGAGGCFGVQADVRGDALDRRVCEQHEPEQHQEQAAEDDAQDHRRALVQPGGSFSNRGRLLPLGPCGYKRLPCPSGAS